MTIMLVQKANTINTLMRVILDRVESAPAGISSAALRAETGMNIHQYDMLVGVLVNTKRIVNENNMLRAR
jgi:hypothetical protein